MSDTIEQPSNAPTNKVAAATVGGAAATLLAFILGELDVHLTPEAGAALATLFAFAAGYFKRERVTAAPSRDDLRARVSGDRGYGLVEVAFALLIVVIALAVVLHYL